MLSLVCMLNDGNASGGLPTFDGGALIVYSRDASGRINPHTVRAPAGSVISFPADLLHEVRPVRSGTRLSAIAWICDLHESERLVNP